MMKVARIPSEAGVNVAAAIAVNRSEPKTVRRMSLIGVVTG